MVKLQTLKVYSFSFSTSPLTPGKKGTGLGVSPVPGPLTRVSPVCIDSELNKIIFPPTMSLRTRPDRGYQTSGGARIASVEQETGL